MKQKLTSSIASLMLATGLIVTAAAAWAQATDIGFAKAEAIALTQVKGTVREISRKEKLGKALFKVEVRTPDGKSFDVYLEASDGRVLQVKED